MTAVCVIPNCGRSCAAEQPFCTDHRDDSLTPEEAWQDLLEKDDRTSPADCPDMALITFEELRQYMLFARWRAERKARP